MANRIGVQEEERDIEKERKRDRERMSGSVQVVSVDGTSDDKCSGLVAV